MSPASSRPLRIASTMSGASQASRSDRAILATVEHPLQAPCSRECLEQCAARLRFRGRRDRNAIGGDDPLLAAAALEAHGGQTITVLEIGGSVLFLPRAKLPSLRSTWLS